MSEPPGGASAARRRFCRSSRSPGCCCCRAARLPLNIFEPRYLAMTRDALAGERLIGMVQPSDPQRACAAGNPPVYPTGCAGRITAFAETDDGRFLITLTGVSPFPHPRGAAAAERLSPRDPGLGANSPATSRADDAPQFDRERLMRGLQSYFRAAPDLGRLGCDREGAGRAADHLDRDGLPVRAEREAGSARGARSRRARARC